jgi:hypothetical protein
VSEVTIVNLEADMAADLEHIELTCFPMANPDDLLSKDDILAYADVFPEGYFVALANGRPVGMGAGIYLDFDFDHPQHNGQLHDPTLTFQLSHGFEVRGLLENYLEDEADDGWATLIVWENRSSSTPTIDP